MDELRGEKLNRVKLVEKEKDELEKPKNEAMEYLRSENDISHKKNFIYQHYIKTFDEKIEETKQKQAEFQEKGKHTAGGVAKKNFCFVVTHYISLWTLKYQNIPPQ